MSEVLNNEQIKQLLRSILVDIAQRSDAEQSFEATHARTGETSDSGLNSELKSIDDRYYAEQAVAHREYDIERNEMLNLFEVDLNSVQCEYESVFQEIHRVSELECEAAQRDQADARWMVTSVLDDQSEESPVYQFKSYKSRLTATKDRLDEKHREIESAVEAAACILKERRQWREVGPAESIIPPRNCQESLDLFNSACQLIPQSIASLVKQKLPHLFSSWRPGALFALTWLPLFALLLLQVDPRALHLRIVPSGSEWVLAAAGIAAAATLFVIISLYAVSRSRSGRLLREMRLAVAELNQGHTYWLEFSKHESSRRRQQCSRQYAEITTQREQAFEKIDSIADRTIQESLSQKQRRLADAEAKYPACMEEITSARQKQICEIDERHQQKMAELAAGRTCEQETARQVHARIKAQQRSNKLRDREAIAETWLAAQTRFTDAVLKINSDSRETTPAWKQLLADDWTLPDVIPQSIRFGCYNFDFRQIADGLPHEKRLWPKQTRFELPAVLPFPDRSSLLLKTRRSGRAEAVDSMRSVMLRLLTSLPPGTVRFTIVDPVGLGEEFSTFMHLADYDELLVGSRIWTEAAQIEKRLADLSEHIENIFQAYLRNEFESIDEYNRQAGEVAEPYHVLVVANFPTNFSETAARRLVSIANSGARCGVSTLISVDANQTLPHNFDLTDLEAAATTLEWRENGFVACDPELSWLPMRLDAPPACGEMSEIVRVVGRQSVNARRVEVPFERVTPPDDDLWSLDSRSGIDVPLGRAGAMKLQSLRLGKGTSQHALVAGKTGSGKSSFLHALITNLALHYSPAEVEFFLIDFKKGVEFKTYATHALPHARIIGIESDREFGVSVLERLDAVLRERGELFRGRGVQDIESFRNAQPAERLPRILLIVDEFQEFFVEDDHFSQRATLLLDRLIRQGRAFGIHVLLGSQTLGGAYSLARSTLGQVAVRIALQCSESDAHLVLSEENMAARLLSRPGEAIYNDANGLLEGNHPFQIAWLPDDRRENYLQRLQEMAKRQQLEIEPPIVFEGHAPSDPRRNRGLVRMIEDFGSETESSPDRAAPVVWLGDAVSIKAPTQIAFHRRPGDNLLIVGQEASSARGLLALSFICLAAQQKISSPIDDSGVFRFFILDGDADQADASAEWKRLIETVSDSIHQTGQARAAAAIELVAAEVSRRTAEGHGDEHPIFLFISNLSRFRDLKTSHDDYGFSSSNDGSPPSPDKLLADILREGPAVGIHSIVSCDSYSNLNRWMSLPIQREFELRVAFRMNGADSSSLIDSPAASKLGLHRALCYLGETGISEKFRPYAVPSERWLDWVAERLRIPQTVIPTCDDIDMWTVR